MKYDQLAKRQRRHVIVYGEPKSGKSTLVSQLALKHKLFWISLDNGHTVIDKLPQEARDNVEIVVIPDTRENPIGWKTLVKIFSGGPCDICDLHGDSSCATCRAKLGTFTHCHLNGLDPDTIVVWDHATQLSRSVDAAIANKKKDPDDYKLDWDDWAKMKNIHDRIFSAIQNATYNCVVIAHVIESELEDGNKKLLPYIGTRAYARSVGGFFDSMIYCEMLNKSHKFGSRTTYSISATTGSRDDIAIEEAKAPSLLPFFDGTIPKAEVHGAAAAAAILATPAKPVVIIENPPQKAAQETVVPVQTDHERAQELLKKLRR